MTAEHDETTSGTSCSITTPTAFANSTTRCRAGGCTASTSPSCLRVVYLVNYHVLPRPMVGRAGMVAEYQAELEAAARGAGRPAGGRGDAALVALWTKPAWRKARPSSRARQRVFRPAIARTSAGWSART